MNDAKISIDDLVDKLKQEHDEIQVKLHLAKLEASDEWEKIQAKLVNLESKAKEVSGVTVDVSSDIGAAAKLLGEEISDGFKKIIKHL